MKKVLIIAYNDLNNSGVPNVIFQTIKALCDKFSFDVLIFGDDDYYYKKLKKDNIDVSLIKYCEKKPKSKMARLFWWFYKRPHNHYLFMKELLKKNDYFAIHSFKEYDGWPFLKAAKEAKIQKRIFHCNVNLLSHRTSKTKVLFDHNKRLSLKYATTLVGVSEISCKNAFFDKPYKVLFNSYDETRFNMNVENKLLKDELVLTHVASYNDNKNQLFSLSLLKELKRFQQNAKLNLIGGDEIDSYYKNLIEFSKNNNLVNDVSFIKKTSNVEDYFEKTSFLILPSFSEGLPLTVIEAQACGIKSFVSTNVTRELNVGGVEFLDLNKGAFYWAAEIYKIFKEQNNARQQYDLTPFSFKNFKMELEQIYEIK